MKDDHADSPGTGLAPEFRLPAAPTPWAPPPLVESPAAEWFRSVWRYRWLVLAVTVVGTAAGFGLTRILAPVYRADATVWVEAGDARYPERGGPVGPGQLLDSYAWIELLKSYVVLDRVVREQGLYVQAKPAVRAGLLADFAVRDGFRPGTYRLDVDDDGRRYTLSDERGGVLERGAPGDSIGRGIAFAWAPAPERFEPGQRIEFSLLTWREAARRLADRLDPRMDPGGNFLRISLSGENPQRVADILNAIVQRYVAVAGQLKREKVIGLGQRLEEQLTRAKEQLQSSEEALRRFQQSVGMRPAVSDGPSDPRLSSYLELSSSLSQTQRDREAIESALRASADTSHGWASLTFIGAVQQSPGLKGALDELDQKLAELRGLRYRYTDRHPDVQRLAGQVDILAARTIPELARQLADELRAREAQLDRSVATASTQVRAIPSQVIEEARLKRQVTIADNLYTTLQQRYDEARLAEASSVPDVRILDAAVAPTDPVENTAPRLMLMAFVGSLGASVVGATLLARLDRRVRSPEQVGLELGLPLLGLIPHIHSRGKRLTDEQAGLYREAIREAIPVPEAQCDGAVTESRKHPILSPEAGRGLLRAGELLDLPAIDRERVVEALVALDELLDRDRGGALGPERLERAVQRLAAVHPHGPLGAGGGARLEDEREAHVLGEGVGLGGAVHGRRRRGRHPRLAQRLLHRRLVPAQPGRPHRRPGDAAGLTHLGDRQGVGLDRGLQPVHPLARLDAAHGAEQRRLVRHRADLLVPVEPVLQLAVERVERPLADARDARPRGAQGAHELALVGREPGLDQDDVHGGLAVARLCPMAAARLSRPARGTARRNAAPGWPR